MLDIIKNPIFLGLIAGVLTYLYLYWNNSQKKHRKQQKKIDITYPALIGAITVMLAYLYNICFVKDSDGSTDSSNYESDSYSGEESIFSQQPMLQSNTKMLQATNLKLPPVLLEMYD